MLLKYGIFRGANSDNLAIELASVSHSRTQIKPEKFTKLKKQFTFEEGICNVEKKKHICFW